MTRCFVALWPPDEVIEAMVALQTGVDGARWSRRENLHVTLRFLGEVDVDAAIAAVAAVRHPPVEVVLGPAAGAMFGHVLAAPVAGVDGLAAAVRASTVDLVPDDKRPYRGHLTLGRVPEGIEVSWAPPASMSWTADRFALVSSRYDGDRHVYETITEVVLV
ncbi:MAG: RNA 2',3'-cyclic phosphodiesterase [Actinomycetota bacterium]